MNSHHSPENQAWASANEIIIIVHDNKKISYDVKSSSSKALAALLLEKIAIFLVCILLYV